MKIQNDDEESKVVDTFVGAGHQHYGFGAVLVHHLPSILKSLAVLILALAALIRAIHLLD